MYTFSATTSLTFIVTSTNSETVLNSPYYNVGTFGPQLTSALANQTVSLGTVISYQLPAFQGADITDIIIVSTGLLPRFANLSGTSLNFAPVSGTDTIGTSVIVIILSDQFQNKNSYSMEVTVTVTLIIIGTPVITTPNSSIVISIPLETPSF